MSNELNAINKCHGIEYVEEILIKYNQINQITECIQCSVKLKRFVNICTSVKLFTIKMLECLSFCQYGNNV